MSFQYDGDPGDRHHRFYQDGTGSHAARHAFLAVMLAVSVFFLVLSLSARQATQPGTGQHVIQSGIASLTDIDRLFAEDGDALRRLAENTDTGAFAIPGYPLDIRVTREEAATLTNDQLRDLVLSRSSAVVYTQGLSAFDRTGSASISRFSSQGALKTMVGELSESTNHKATIATLFFAVLVAIFAVALDSHAVVACAVKGCICSVSVGQWDALSDAAPPLPLATTGTLLEERAERLLASLGIESTPEIDFTVLAADPGAFVAPPRWKVMPSTRSLP